MSSLMTRVRRLERIHRSDPTATAEPTDPHRHDWYSRLCPCGLEPGECRTHPRATAKQCPPSRDWQTWLVLAGRGFGKTRVGAEWIRYQAETGRARRMAIVGATAGDARDVMVEGESGIMAISHPQFRPRYEPSKRRLTWPDGAIATTYTADEPDRLRGPQHDAAWADELCAWNRPEAWDNLQLGLRLGGHPRSCVTTTPRPTKLLKALMAEPTTAITRGSTYENRTHLAPSFFDAIVRKYEGSRLGEQEIHAEVLDISEGAWFARFDPRRHMSELADYHVGYPVHLAIDCGTSLHVAAVWFQVRPLDPRDRMEAPERVEAIRAPDGYRVPPAPLRQVPDYGPRNTVTVFGEWHGEGYYSEAAARAIVEHGGTLPGCGGRADTVRLDPAASARSGLGPAAYGEFERVFGPRVMGRWPSHRVTDGLDQLEVLMDTGCLILHPRCEGLKAAFQNYVRDQRGGEWLDSPKDPQHPHEDYMDALRGGVRDQFPEGRPAPSLLRRAHA